jgi:hypothetical protein
MFIGASYRAFWYDLAIFSQLFYAAVFRQNKNPAEALKMAKKQYPRTFRGRHFIEVYKSRKKRKPPKKAGGQQ